MRNELATGLLFPDIMKALMSTLLAATLLAPSCATDPSGEWQGYLFPPFDALPIAFDISGDSLGHWSGTFLAPEFGVDSLSLREIQLDGDSLVLAVGWGESALHFRGRLDEDFFRGAFHEGGTPTPFAVARVGTAAARALDTKAAQQRGHQP